METKAVTNSNYDAVFNQVQDFMGPMVSAEEVHHAINRMVLNARTGKKNLLGVAQEILGPLSTMQEARGLLKVVGAALTTSI